MMWFVMALIGYAALALTLVLDKMILERDAASPAVYAFYSTLFTALVLVAIPFGVGMLEGVDWFWAIVSGVTFGLALWAMFIAVDKGSPSHVNPFIGALVTVVVFGLSFYFLNETLTIAQMVGMIVLVGATLLLALRRCGDHLQFTKGVKWAALAAILFAVSHVSAKYLYDLYPFMTGFVWTRGTIALVGVFLLVRQDVRDMFAATSVKKKKIITRGKTFFKRHNHAIVFSNKILGVLGVVFVQYATSLGSVTMVNAMHGLEYTLMFLIIYMLTKKAPKIFNEKFTKNQLRIEVLALVLVVVGSALFVL